ncbi:MAG: hypothetical protein WBI06_14600 [Paludibacter sp.]
MLRRRLLSSTVGSKAVGNVCDLRFLIDLGREEIDTGEGTGGGTGKGEGTGGRGGTGTGV